MKQYAPNLVPILLLAGLGVLQSCQVGQVNYSKALFETMPDDPQLLVLVRPNELFTFVGRQALLTNFNISDIIDPKWRLDIKQLQQYGDLTIEILKAVGIPWEKVETVGVLMYFGKPVFLLSGDFKANAVKGKLSELGFKQEHTGFFEYVYAEQKMAIPKDGLMMMGEEMVLDDLLSIPKDRTLWNKKEFAEYRLTSPLDNTIFTWSQPPKELFQDWEFQDKLGNVSLAIDLKSNISAKSVVHLNDPDYAVYLKDLMLGAVTFGRGLLGKDETYGPILRSIKITHESNRVTAAMVITGGQAEALRDKIVQELQNPEAGTLENFFEFLGKFQ